VAKFFTKKQTRDRYFTDLLLHTVSAKFAELYNVLNPPRRIAFVPSYVLELCDRIASPIVSLCTVEPFIEDERIRLNNSSGYVNSDNQRNTPQAFSHFSLEHSNQELVIIDIQRVSDFYYAPQIHTKSGKGFGEGNLGQNGIWQFTKTHNCNPLCSYLKLKPLNPSYTTRRMVLRGTLPVVQLQFDQSTPPTTSKAGNEGAQENAG